MNAVDGQVAAVVAVAGPLDLAGRVVERFTALADAHGGRITEQSSVDLTAIFPSVPQGLLAATELLLAPEFCTVRCGVVALDFDSPGSADTAATHARQLCRTTELGQLAFAALSAILTPPADDEHDLRIAGRRQELDTLAHAMSAAESGSPQVLTLAGELGTGRTTLLEQVRAWARAKNFAILQVVGAGGVVGGRWSSLQAATLIVPGAAGARRLVDHLPSLSGDDRPDVAGIVHELLGLVAVLTENDPLVITVDDVDLLDEASRSALQTVAAGLVVERCLLVAAGPKGLESWPGGTVVGLHDLDAEAVERIVRRDGPIDAGVLRRCVEFAGGNALAAREVSRSLSSRQRSGQERLPVVPEPAAAVFTGFQRLLAQAPEPAQRAAVVAAADETGDSAVVRAALVALGEDPGGLDQAEVAGLLALDGAGLRFSHPLLRSVAYHQVAAGSRRAAHKALAVALDRPRQATDRAYQLAAASDGPSESASEALALVAESEVVRGDALAAARASAAAARLTADDAVRDRRLSRAAALYVRCGDLASADEALAMMSNPERVPDAVVARCLVDVARLGPARARSTVARLGPEGELPGVAQALDAYLGALVGEPPARPEPAQPLTMAARVMTGADPASTLLGCGRSVGVLGGLEASLVAHALAMAGWSTEASALVRELDVDTALIDPVGVQAAAGLLALDAARPIAALELLGDAGASAAEASPAEVLRLLALARARLYCGRWDDADHALRDAAAIVGRLGLVVHESDIDLLSGLVLHARGRDEGVELLAAAARTRPDRALPELVIATLDRAGRPVSAWTAELRALSESPDRRASLAARRALAALAGDSEELMSVTKQFREAGLELEAMLTQGSAVSTAVRTGSPDHARLRKELAVQATRRGLVHPGSHYWEAGGAQNRLQATLSPAEYRVAVAVGAGATNKEVSAQLFISVKTVDYHLQNIYRKLGARSRTQLAVIIAGHDASGGTHS